MILSHKGFIKYCMCPPELLWIVRRLQSAPMMKVLEMCLLIGEAPERDLPIHQSMLGNLPVFQLLLFSSYTSSVADVFAHRGQ